MLKVNFWKSLVAVVVGNVLYLFVISPYLPVQARHHPSRFDLGLIIDFWFCLVIYGIIELLLRFRRRDSAKT